MSVYEQKRQAHLAVYPGDERGALEYAQGRRSMNDAEMQLAAIRIATSQLRGQFPAATSDDINRRAQEIFQVLQSADPKGRTGGGAGTGAGAGFTPDPNAGGRTPAPNFTPTPGEPRSEAERPAPTGQTSARPSRRPKVGDTVTSNGRKLRITRVLGGGRVEVRDSQTNERFTAKVK